MTNSIVVQVRAGQGLADTFALVHRLGALGFSAHGSLLHQIGQCGNQIGCQFWERALEEHASLQQQPDYNDAPLATLFRAIDQRHQAVTATSRPTLAGPHTDQPQQPRPLHSQQQHRQLQPQQQAQHQHQQAQRQHQQPEWPPPATAATATSPRSPLATLRARAVLIDMEEGVVNELRKGPQGALFDPDLCVTSVSGSGNNWAVGYHGYGSRYGDTISETLRRAAEQCDCLQSFFLLHSMGGGTGSGLGTYVLQRLRDEYPSVYRFVTAVYPSEVCSTWVSNFQPAPRLFNIQWGLPSSSSLHHSVFAFPTVLAGR